MAKPVLLTVDDDPDVLRAVERDLRKEYAENYRVLRADSGMTQQWLGRIVACHLAHVAVMGQPAHPSPLAVPNAEVTVSSTQVGFRVTITSRDREIARDVVEQGRQLASASPATIAWY